MAAEGVVQYATHQEVEFFTDAGETVICHPSDVVLIEPKYEHDGIYQDADGKVYRYTRNNGRQVWQQIVPFIGTAWHEKDAPARPLRKMVPAS